MGCLLIYLIETVFSGLVLGSSRDKFFLVMHSCVATLDHTVVLFDKFLGHFLVILFLGRLSVVILDTHVLRVRY